MSESKVEKTESGRLIRKATEDIREFIEDNVEEFPTEIVRVVVEQFNISRQAAHSHVAALVDEGILTGEGSTRNRTYKVAVLDEAKLDSVDLAGLEEDVVWRHHVAKLMEPVPGHCHQIAHFVFTEMVNNAVDHSGGTKLSMSVTRTASKVRMVIKDDGVGIFRKIKDHMGLDDERHSILELTKGKFTTDPAAHSGLGIFFSTRASDEFSIRAGSLLFAHTRTNMDWLVDDMPFQQGTTIVCVVNTSTKRSLANVFAEFSAPANPGFSRTTIPVFVAQYGEENLVSRSQAKRVLARVDRFKEVVFDFKDVELIGQAFADEIFRVFARSHPEVHVEYINASPEVERMIDLALHA